jgi:hypothetical protein
MLTFLSQRGTAVTLCATLIAIAASGCVYDSSERCGPAMTFVEAVNACVCDANAVPVPGGCQACAPDEVPSGGECACAAGQTKSADNVCVAVAGLGDPCNATTAPCTDTTYSFCAIKSGGTAGTCTKACGSNDDCSTAYTCATWESHPFCRTFEGFGASCAGPADCTGDAAFCDSFMTHTCIVAGCSLTANECPRGTMCCDLSRFGLGTLCAAGACP